MSLDYNLQPKNKFQCAKKNSGGGQEELESLLTAIFYQDVS